MMLHKEIQDTIERLRICRSSSHHVMTAFMDGIGGVYHDCEKFKAAFIDLLEQADPDTHMILPVDADGEVIHIVDEMDFSESVRGLTVIGVGTSSVNDSDMGVFVRDDDGYMWFNARFLRHHHAPTVEDVLREFGDEVQRCCDTEDTIAEYAAKLREVMQDD